MKTLLKSFCLATAILLAGFCASTVIVGCKSSQQQTAFDTLYSVEQVTVSAYDSYVTLVIQGTVSTNGVPQVSKAFNTFQASCLIALDAVQYNTNALCPPDLLVESQDVVNLITDIKKDLK